MGISSAMYVALTGMRMSQAAMEVSSHNIANVNTAGYSRQRINLATLPTWNASWGQMGLGVDANNITRYADQFLTRSVIMTGSTLGHNITMKSSMDNLELFYNESNGNGINQAMSDFFNSFSQLADEPNNKPYKEELIEYAQSLATQLGLRRDEMDELRTDTNKRISDGITEVNKLLAEIASINQEITVYEDPTLNRQANDLRDTREELTRQLAEYMNIDYYEDPHDGQWTITSKIGIPLVLKNKDFPLVGQTDSAGDVTVHTSHNQYWMEDITGSIDSGAIGGYLEFREEVLLEYYRQYDSFVDGLIFNVNNQHAQGAGEALFSEAVATTKVSNLASVEIAFPGDDNDLRISSLVPHLASKEPYSDYYSDPENIEVRFEKAKSPTSEITSTVKFNDDPDRMKWEITITLPCDSNGNVTVTTRELCDYVNSEKSKSPSDGINYLPPRTVSWKVGDFISAEGVANQGDTGRVVIDGPTYPYQAGQFVTLDRSLKYTTPQGQHLSYGLETAELKTAFKHTNNDILFTAIEKGAAGENISIEYCYPGAGNQDLFVRVDPGDDSSQNIKVFLATDANGNVTTTAGDIVAAINGHVKARTLVTAETPAGENGLGMVEAMDKTFLDRSGYFTVVTYKEGEEPEFHKVTVNPDDKIEDILNQIGATFDKGIPGLRVESITDLHGKDTIRIIADDGVKFGYAGDSSGALAVLGLNTILTGNNGANVGVNQLLIDNRDYINAGHIDSNGVIAEGDNTNALDMSDLRDDRYSFYHQSSATLETAFNSIYANIGASAQGATRNYEFTQGVYDQLQNRLDSIAGVNLDEELADILRFQYMYQASAKMISTIDTMMETLLAMR
ncbi:MAG: flagellar hook-associated protein FlgK [Deltaproteobacteria bacterium]|jgi:flagellar hook-associated protein FlgK|nr:flagellar hook-associated protein FlgK [Deltaproteobacteria bacterium]